MIECLHVILKNQQVMSCSIELNKHHVHMNQGYLTPPKVIGEKR